MNYFSKLKNKGFTLTELIVVITIATIITTALVFQQAKWNDNLAVSTQAYDLALMIRQAQIYSLGVKEDKSATSGDKFNIGYGININQNTPGQYIYFADRNGNQEYDSSPDETIEPKTFNRGVVIDRICGIYQGNLSETCSPYQQLTQINISFLRPETKATLNFIDSNNNTINPLDPPVSVYLKSKGNKQYKVTVEISGQISMTQI